MIESCKRFCMQWRGENVKKRNISKVLVAVIILSTVIFAAFGCGDSGPTGAVKEFMEAFKAKDCEKYVGMLDLKSLEDMVGATGMSMDDMKKTLVDECNASKNDDELVDYTIGEEKMDGDDKATVEVEATIKSGGEETKDSQTFHLVKVDGEWKIDIASSVGL